MNELKVSRFDPRRIPDLGVVVFVGRSGSGKTVAMTDVLYHKRHTYSRVLVMTGSSDTAEHFSKFVPPILVHEGFDEARLDAVYRKQEMDVAKKKCKPILIILDDLMYKSKTLEKSEVLNRIFMNGRHAQICMYISMQYCKSLGPQLRQQASYIFCAREKNPENRKRIYEGFNTVFANFTEFNIVMSACTQNREMMVLSNVFSDSDSIADNVFWYKAKVHRHFRVNSKSPMWKLNDHLYDHDHVLRALSASTTSSTGAKTRPTIKRAPLVVKR